MFGDHHNMRKVGVLKVCSHHNGNGVWILVFLIQVPPPTALAYVFPDSRAGRDEVWQIGRGMRPLMDSGGKALGH